VDDESVQPRVVVQPEAAAFIHANGGRVFVWADHSGMKHVRLRPPTDPIVWDETRVEGIDLLVDSSIAQPKVWALVLRRFPRQHVEALWDPRPGGWIESVPAIPFLDR
jgi:hypothetical protein